MTKLRNPKPAVAWGFFITEGIPERAWNPFQLIAFPSKGLAIQTLCHWGKLDPGPIFKIIEPKTTPKKGRSK